MRRHRRRHDRSKYPWRYQRLRRKLIQITIVSSIALLFLCGALYVMLSSSRVRSADADAESMRVDGHGGDADGDNLARVVFTCT